MRIMRALGMTAGAIAVVTLAAGAAYVFWMLRLWGAAVRATDPLDATGVDLVAPRKFA